MVSCTQLDLKKGYERDIVSSWRNLHCGIPHLVLRLSDQRHQNRSMSVPQQYNPTLLVSLHARFWYQNSTGITGGVDRYRDEIGHYDENAVTSLVIIQYFFRVAIALYLYLYVSRATSL